MRTLLLTMLPVLAFMSVPARAQNTQESFVPPMGNWSLPPSGQQAPEPTPTPAPEPQQTQTPPPVVVPTATPRPAPTTQPRATAPQATPAPAPRQDAPEPTPAIETPQSEQTPADDVPAPLPDIAEPIQQPLPDTTPVPEMADQPSSGLPRWLVALVAVALAGGAGWFLFRRRRIHKADADEGQEEVAPVADVQPIAPQPEPRAPMAPVPVRRVPGEVTSPAVRRAVPVAPTTPTPGGTSTPSVAPPASGDALPKGLITTRIPALGRTSPPPSPQPQAAKQAASVVPLAPPPSRPRANGGGLGFVLNAQRITVSLTQLMLEFELIAENHTDIAVASLDVATAMLTAHADQDAQIARFFAERPESPATALDVGPQMARGLNGKLSMPLGQVNPVETGGRSYCVPIMMIDARYTWADGREERKSVAFVMGKGAQDANKLGPIFLDRGPGVTREVGARLHVPMRKAS